MIIEKVALSKEMYQEARENKTSFTVILKKKAIKEGKFIADSPLDVLQQQLAARDLQLAGAHASLVEDFFRTEEHKILFPEVINQMVEVGIKEQLANFAGIEDITATKTGIDGVVYNSAMVDLNASPALPKRVGEGGEIPTVLIKFKDKVIKLRKVGYKIAMTYETARQMKINVFGVTMKVIGRNIAREEVNQAVDVLINGDGNSNPIASINAATSGTLTYADIVNLQEEFEYFNPTMMIAPKAMRIKYLNLTEYKDKNGPSMPQPPKRCDGMPANKIIALDSSACLERVTENGGSLVEYNKIIESQIENAVISEVFIYSKLFVDAAKMLNGTF